MSRLSQSMPAVVLSVLLSYAVQTTAATPSTIQVSNSEQMVTIAKALVATVADEPSKLMLPFDDQAKKDWAYWPKQRQGLSLQRMTVEQRGLSHDLLSSLLSSQGYMKVINIVQLEQVLAALDTRGTPRVMGAYHLTVFGTPSQNTPWAWQFEGHHVSLNVSVMADDVAVTPSFLGANPANIPSGPLAGFRALRYEQAHGLRLVLSMTAEQRAEAVLAADPPKDILTAPNNKDADGALVWKQSLRPEGIAVAGLSTQQKTWVRRILDEVVTNYRPEISSAYLKQIDVEQLSFVWSGGLSLNEANYYRLQGPDFVFEFDSAVGGGNHVHTVWHSASGNFGANLLKQHYQHTEH